MSPVVEPLAQLVTVKELADILRLKPAAVYRSARLGRLPHVRCGKAIRFDARAVIASLQRGACA